ncbi:MAG: hypothetical protein ACLRQF_10350 [Thomasclavelia ramosa]
MLSKINIIKNKLVIKPFKNSHPVVLFAYFSFSYYSNNYSTKLLFNHFVDS